VPTGDIESTIARVRLELSDGFRAHLSENEVSWIDLYDRLSRAVDRLLTELGT
jgi:hypothetical protein